MAARPCALGLEVLRAALGCIQLSIQSRSVYNLFLQQGGWAAVLAKDWGFATALACHIGWITSATYGARLSGFLCCACRVAPKVSLFAQLVAQRVLPPTAEWLNETSDQRYKLCWKAMAEVFVYTCGELPSSLVLLVAAFEAVCTVAIWASMYIVKAAHPTPAAAAAHVLIRLSLSICVNYCQRRTNFRGVRNVFSTYWPKPYEEPRTFKDDITYGILRSQTPVYNSIMCCNNPAVLSLITASSSKDLQPVRLERLGTSGAIGEAAAAGKLAGTPVDSASTTCSIQAYDLARQLVSSAGTSGVSSPDGSSYTSAAQKVRVSVKIPDRSPEDLQSSWDTDLHINGPRRAVVLFTYIRRGCIQLVIDLVTPTPVSCLTHVLAGREGMELDGAQPFSRRAAETGDEKEACGGLENPSSLALTTEPEGSRKAESVSQLHDEWRARSDCKALGGVGLERRLKPCSETALPMCGDQTSPAPEAAPGDAHGHLLRTICSESLLAGRTLTVQVDATASLVRVEASGGTDTASSGRQHITAVAESLPAMPPTVRVWKHVVCTGSRLSAFRACVWPCRRQHPAPPREVALACSWAEALGAGGAEAPVGHSDGVSKWQNGAQVQLTVRQQGQFLPVAYVAAGEHRKGRSTQVRLLRAGLAEGNVAVSVGSSSCSTPDVGAVKGELQTGRGGSEGLTAPNGPGTHFFAFIPSNSNGLAEVELSWSGVHSATATSVLLVSCPAIACEFEQLQAAAERGLDTDYAPRQSMVLDVIRDFGVFMDIVPALSGGRDGVSTADGIPSCRQPVIEWSLVQISDEGLSVPVPTRVILVGPQTESTSRHASQLRSLSPELDSKGSGCAPPGDTSFRMCAAEDGDRTDVAVEGWEEYLTQRTRSLASFGCQLGLSLLRYFLSTGMTACAVRVLDVLHHQLGIPVRMLTSHESCRQQLTLLHYAARSGSFRTLAAVALWMEEHGVEPNWSGATPRGITPLHLLAVVPNNEVAVTLVQLRWPAARRAWNSSKVENATPAQFASMACGSNAASMAPYWWQHAASSSVVSWAVGSTWRCLVAMRRWQGLHQISRCCGVILAPARGFLLPSLELSYAAWLHRRVAFMDHIYMSLYTAHFLTMLVKGGWAFYMEHVAGLILLVLRLSLLVLHSPLKVVLYRRLSSFRRREAAQAGRKGRKEFESDEDGRRSRHWLFTSREKTAILMEQLRLVVIALMAAGVLPLPRSWVRLVQLRLDFIINAVMRPTASQMRLLTSVVSSAFALVAEATITAVITKQPGTWALWNLMLGFARGAFTHGLGLSLTVLLQTSARARFLAEMRGQLVAK